MSNPPPLHRAPVAATRSDRVRHRAFWLLRNGGLGVLIFFARPLLVPLLRPIDAQCCSWVLLPIAAAVTIGWHLPRGAPAASITFTLLLVLQIDWSPELPGPTARTLWPLHVGVAFAGCAAMLFGESLAAVRRIARDRQLAAANQTDDPPAPAATPRPPTSA